MNQTQAAPTMLKRFALPLFCLLIALASVPVAYGVPLALPGAPPLLVDSLSVDFLAPAALLAQGAVVVPKGALSRIKEKIKSALSLGDDVDLDAALDGTLEEGEVARSAAPSTPAAPKAPADDDNPLAAQLGQLQETVSGLQEMLREEREARQAAQKALQDQNAKRDANAIQDALDAAEADGRIVPEKRDFWKGLFEKDLDGTAAILDELPPNPAMKRQATTRNDAKTTTAKTDADVPAHVAHREAAKNYFGQQSAAQA